MSGKWVAHTDVANQVLIRNPVDEAVSAINKLLISAKNGGFNANGAKVSYAFSWMEDKTRFMLEGYGTTDDS